MLCLGPGPPSLLHLTRANAEKPYAGDTTQVRMESSKCGSGTAIGFFDFSPFLKFCFWVQLVQTLEKIRVCHHRYGEIA
jgi:hypothetical protein